MMIAATFLLDIFLISFTKQLSRLWIFFSIQEDAVLFQHPLLSPCSGNSVNYTYFQMLKYCLSTLSGTCCWICFLDQVESFRACTHERHQLVVFVFVMLLNGFQSYFTNWYVKYSLFYFLKASQLFLIFLKWLTKLAVTPGTGVSLWSSFWVQLLQQMLLLRISRLKLLLFWIYE